MFKNKLCFLIKDNNAVKIPRPKEEIRISEKNKLKLSGITSPSLIFIIFLVKSQIPYPILALQWCCSELLAFNCAIAEIFG
jgi:hypothetical protein